VGAILAVLTADLDQRFCAELAGEPVLHGETSHFRESIRPSRGFGKQNLKLWRSEMTPHDDVGFRPGSLEMSG
jgi:hypothetical protein